MVAHRPALLALADQRDHAADARAGAASPPARVGGPAPTPSPGRRPVGGAPTAAARPASSGPSTLLGALASASGVALTATAGWLIVQASTQPAVLTLLVAIVAVRTFGLARPVLRYAERLRSHDVALRLLARATGRRCTTPSCR